VIFLFKLLYPIYGNRIAARATTLFVLNPFAIYLFNGYSEAAWVLCIVMFFYSLVAQNNPYAAAVCVALGSASRPYGVVLVAIMLFHMLCRYLQKNGLRVDLSASEVRAAAICVPLSFVGLAAYTTYLFVRFGNPLAFKENLVAWGGPPGIIINVFPFFTLRYVFYNLVHPFWGDIPNPHVPIFLAHPFSIAAILFVGMPLALIHYRKRISVTLLFFSFFFMAFHYVRGYYAPYLMMNMGRQLMICFPFAIALALACDKRDKVEAQSASTLVVENNGTLINNLLGRLNWRFALLFIIFAALFAKYTYEYYCFRWIS
jgi:hypothetical protein